MSSARRPYGEGGITPRTKNGKAYFVASISAGTDELGKRVRPEVWCKTRPIAVKALRELEREAADGAAQRTNSRGETLAEYLSDWAASVNLKKSSVLRYKQTIRVDIIPIAGKLRVVDLDPTRDGIERVQAFYKKLRATGASDDKVRKAHATLSAALSDAVPRYIKGNPCLLIPKRLKPQANTPKRIEYDLEELEAFRVAVRGDRLEALYLLGMTAMREGEIFALQKRDVDLVAGTVFVQATLTDVSHSERELGEPKNPDEGRMLIGLPAYAIAALRRHLSSSAVLARGASASPYVFPDQRGGPMRRQNFLRRDFYPILERAGLRRIHFHDLRHSVATALSAHVPTLAIKQRLGQASLAMAAHYGGHRNAANDTLVVAALDRLFPENWREIGGKAD